MIWKAVCSRGIIKWNKLHFFTKVIPHRPPPGVTTKGLYQGFFLQNQNNFHQWQTLSKILNRSQFRRGWCMACSTTFLLLLFKCFIDTSPILLVINEHFIGCCIQVLIELSLMLFAGLNKQVLLTRRCCSQTAAISIQLLIMWQMSLTDSSS